MYNFQPYFLVNKLYLRTYNKYTSTHFCYVLQQSSWRNGIQTMDVAASHTSQNKRQNDFEIISTFIRQHSQRSKTI